ncbi:hypothetical protein TNCV_3200701 [Trichonephila clavipes]|nr:hypothetical protein TNCV_3200701 [Trichonephila clavipes]
MEEQVYHLLNGKKTSSDSHLKPGKDPKNPLSYRPIALTSCPLCCQTPLGETDRTSLLPASVPGNRLSRIDTDVLYTDQRATLL